MRDTLTRALCAFALIVSVVLSLTNPSGELQKALFHLSSLQQVDQYPNQNQLQYNFYRESCPTAERIIRNTMKELYAVNSSTVPQLLRLFFHDCFVGGCDASILLDETGSSGENQTEKESAPNQTLKGFDKMEIIKSRLEEVCPGTVSCADALVLATREGILLAGGPYYPVFTGRSDSDRSHFSDSLTDLPSPDDNLTTTLAKFAAKGFSARETVTLLGGHNIGTIDCDFIRSRLYNFSGTGRPDPTLETGFRNYLIYFCDNTGSVARPVQHFPLPPRIGMAYYQTLYPSVSSGRGFDTHYYKSLQMRKGLLFADQQLMANPTTRLLVNAYASDDGSAFRRDFARAMVKLTSLSGVSNSQARARYSCSLLSPVFNN